MEAANAYQQPVVLDGTYVAQADLKDFSKVERSTDTEVPIIEGLLYKGETMIITADAKIGKTLLAMQLAACVSTGANFLGLKTDVGAVLYLNLEVREQSFENRCVDIKESMGLLPDDGMFMFRTLETDECVDPDDFTTRVYEAIVCIERPISLVIIDPLYMIGDSDENAVQGSRRVIRPLREIAQEFNVGIIVTHHHSKSYQGNQSIVNRGSGSGALGRFFGAVVDIMPVHASSTLWKKQVELMNADPSIKVPDSKEWLLNDSDNATAFVLEAETRDFSRFSPIGLWKRYPGFYRDLTGELSGAMYQHTTNVPRRSNGADERIEAALIELEKAGITRPTYAQLGKQLGVNRDQASKLVKQSQEFTAVDGDGRAKVVVRVNPEEQGICDSQYDSQVAQESPPG